MRYLSIDIETTGINKDFCDIIEFGAILEDTNDPKPYEECPKFHRYLKPSRPEGYQGELYAINMHCESGIWKELNRLDQLQGKMRRNPNMDDFSPDEFFAAQKLISPRKLLHEFTCFLIENGFENIGKPDEQPKVNLGKVTVAGKCFFAFDWYFLAPLFGERICRRAIDPAIMWWNPLEDEKLPSTPECLKRAGLEASGEHTSLGDAWDVIRLVREGINRGYVFGT